MRRTERPTRVLLIAALVVYAVNLASNIFLPESSYAGTVGWCAIALAWIFRVRFYIVEKHICRHLVSGGVMLLLLFAFRLLRFRTNGLYPAFGRYMWYCYYIPFIILPVLGLFMSLCIGLSDEASFLRMRPFRISMWVVSAILLGFVFTNDLHGWLLKFSAEELRTGEGAHSYGGFQVIIIIWTVGLSLAAFIILMHRCQVSGCRKRWYIPAAVFTLGSVMYAAYYINGGNSPSVFGVKLYLIQEVCLLIFAGVCEACIDIGLIPSNSGYLKIFELSDWNVVIADAEGKTVYSSGDVRGVTPPVLMASTESSKAVSRGRLLTGFDISGGIAGWVTNISELEHINDRIREKTQELEIENGVIREGESLRLKRAAFETQNRLYDSIIPIVSPQLTMIRDLLEKPDPEKLFTATVLSVYVKRRFNLSIVTDNTEIADISELWLAIRETVEVLQGTGIPAFIDTCGHTDVQADRMLASFEFFEAVIEQTVPGLRSIFVKLNVLNDSPELRILIDTGKQIRFDTPGIERMRRLGAVIDEEYEDGTYAISLSFREGGVSV